MIKKMLYVLVIAILATFYGVTGLQQQWAVGPTVLSLTVLPLFALLVAGRSLLSAIPDIIFGMIDTGLLVIPALLGGALFGVAGAIAGGVIGDAITDAIAGFFEGSIAEWLRKKGIKESRESVTTALGKMTGSFLGSGAVLSLALLFGIQPTFH